MKRGGVVLTLVLSLLLTGCWPLDTQQSGPSPSATPTQDQTAPSTETPPDGTLDPHGHYGRRLPLGVEPKVKSETQVATKGERERLAKVEILNKKDCTVRSARRPKCRYLITMTDVPADWKAGAVVVTAPAQAAPAGFLVRIDEVAGRAVHATEAALADALVQGEFNGERTFTDKDIASETLAPGVTRVTGKPGGHKGVSPRNPAGGLRLFGFNYNLDRDLVPGLTAKGTFSFDFGCAADGGITWKLKPWFHASCDVTQSAGFKVLAGFDGPVDKAKEIAKIDLNPIVFFVGPVPVVLIPHLRLILSAKGTVDAAMAFGADEDAYVRAGIGAGPDKGIYLIFKKDVHGDTNFDTQWGASAVVARLALRQDLMLYGIVGPFIEEALQGSFRSGPSAGAGNLWCFGLALDVAVGLNLDIGIKKWTWGPGRLWFADIFGTCKKGTPPPVPQQNVTLNVTWPTEGAVLPLGKQTKPFSATAIDDSGKHLPVAWGGNLYLGDHDGLFTPTLDKPGRYELVVGPWAGPTLKNPPKKTIHITVEQPRPSLTVFVDKPGWGSKGTVEDVSDTQGTVYELRPVVSGSFAGLGAPCQRVRWTAAAALQLTDLGCNQRITLTQPGDYQASGTITDRFGVSVTRTVRFHVTGATAPPTLQFSPVQFAVNGVVGKTTFGPGDLVGLGYKCLNCSAGTKLTFAWSYSLDGGAYQELFETSRTDTTSGARFGLKDAKPHTVIFQVRGYDSSSKMITRRTSVELSYVLPAPKLSDIVATVDGVRIAPGTRVAPRKTVVFSTTYANKDKALVYAQFGWQWRVNGGTWQTLTGGSDTGTTSTRSLYGGNNGGSYEVRVALNTFPGGVGTTVDVASFSFSQAPYIG